MPEYWMRSIDFAKVAELLKLIINSPGKWSAAELNRAATDSGIFITSEGKPFSLTSCYRYRRIIEKLNLVEKRNRKFVPKLIPGECDKILAHNETGELNNGQRSVLGDRVIGNQDCYDTFWKSFLPSKKPDSLEEFINNGRPIVMNPMKGPKDGRKDSYLTIKNPDHLDNPIIHRGYNAIQAIHFGMRTWGVDHLEFLDEFYQVGWGYHILPVRLEPHENTEATEHILMEALEFRNDWAMASISELILAGCTALKIPIREVRSVLQNWIGAYPNLVSPVTVSNRMILSAQPEKLTPLILRGFLRLRSGEHVSHLQVHRNLEKRLTPSPEKETFIES